MAIKAKYAKKEDIPESLLAYYEPNSDGVYYLQAEGMVQKTVVDEFRTNNIELTNKLKAFEGVDIEEYKTLKNRTDEDFKKAVAEATTRLSQEQIDAAVVTRTKAMKAESEQQLNQANQNLASMKSLLSVAMIDNSVRAEAIKSGVHDTAVDDVVLRARTTFKLGDDNSVTAFDQKGEKLFDKDGQTPLPVSSWVKDLKKSAPHLFKGMDGGGAGGGRHGSGSLDMSKLSPTQKIAAGLNNGS
jgi:hypothetical protein